MSKFEDLREMELDEKVVAGVVVTATIVGGTVFFKRYKDRIVPFLQSKKDELSMRVRAFKDPNTREVEKATGVVIDERIINGIIQSQLKQKLEETIAKMAEKGETVNVEVPEDKEPPIPTKPEEVVVVSKGEKKQEGITPERVAQAVFGLLQRNPDKIGPQALTNLSGYYLGNKYPEQLSNLKEWGWEPILPQLGIIQPNVIWDEKNIVPATSKSIEKTPYGLNDDPTCLGWKFRDKVMRKTMCVYYDVFQE